MSEVVLDEAIANIADGLAVDWAALGTNQPGDTSWAKCLRIINEVANFHRAEAVNLMTEMPTAVATPASSLAGGVPDIWGKYRLANKVGAGSYGAVYRAWDSDLERDVAIKILHDRFGDTRLKDKLLKEGRALARIRHDNVVRVIGVEAHEDRVALCMEFVKGQTLDEFVHQQGRLSAREAIGIGEDLCRALAAVHRAGYIHRDVKAKNVMRDDTGRVVLMDFGTGRMADHPSLVGDRAGTPLYMAPEVLDGEPASASSDVYSLGVLLYYLVTGQYPVDARTIDQLREAHAQRRHRWLSERRPDLQVAFMQVVEKAIALDVDERYANPSELLAALGALRVGPHPWVWRIAKPVIAIAGVIIGMTLLGAMTSAIFNLGFGRSGYVNETLWDYLVWGRRTSFPPFLIFLFVFLIVTALGLLRHLLLIIPPLRRLDTSARSRLRGLAHRLRLDEVPVLASWALLLSTIVTAVALWYFLPVVMAVITLSHATPSELALLSPASAPLHNQYRWILSFVVMFCVMAWYPVIRLVRQGQTLHRGLLAGGIVVTCVSLALLHTPYRAFYFSALFPFDAVMWNGQRCYVVGERGEEQLLYCPQLSPPRNRTVRTGAGALVPLGVRENPFSHLSSSAGP
jgi:predicted Ser/Thr protein kinase